MSYDEDKKFTWQGFVCMHFCSSVSLVPPITTWTPIDGWYFNKVLASVAIWLASSRVGHITSTRIGGCFWSRPTGGDLMTTSIDGSWNQQTSIKWMTYKNENNAYFHFLIVIISPKKKSQNWKDEEGQTAKG